jgi:hypothetical protein
LCLDAGSRKSYGGTGNVWRDLAGYNNGTLTNGPTFSSANGGSIVFDGSNDYVNCGNNSSLNLGAMTIAVWFKPSTDVSGYRAIIMDESVNTGAPWNYRIYLNINTGTVVYDLYGDSGYSGLVSTYAINDNKWHYVCGTRTAVNGTIRLYIDGLLNNIGTDSSNVSALGAAVWLGQSPLFNGSYPFIGNIAQTQIYNRALTPAEIQQNYNATKGRYKL